MDKKYTSVFLTACLAVGCSKEPTPLTSEQIEAHLKNMHTGCAVYTRLARVFFEANFLTYDAGNKLREPEKFYADVLRGRSFPQAYYDQITLHVSENISQEDLAVNAASCASIYERVYKPQ